MWVYHLCRSRYGCSYRHRYDHLHSIIVVLCPPAIVSPLLLENSLLRDFSNVQPVVMDRVVIVFAIVTGRLEHSEAVAVVGAGSAPAT